MWTASPRSLPTMISKTCDINGFDTVLLVQLFSDRIWLSVSQYGGKIGTLLQCSIDESIIDGSTTFEISTLLGKRDDTLLEVYIRQLAERILRLGPKQHSSSSFPSSCPPILLGIAIQDRDSNTFHFILQTLLQMYMQGIQSISSSTST